MKQKEIPRKAFLLIPVSLCPANARALELLSLRTPGIPSDFYVIEKLGVDGAIVWQSTDGCLYQTTYDSEPIKIAQTLTEYFE